MKFNTLAASATAAAFLVDGTFASLRGEPERKLRCRGDGSFGPPSCEKIQGRIDDARGVQGVLGGLFASGNDFAGEIEEKVGRMLEFAQARQVECDDDSSGQTEGAGPFRGEGKPFRGDGQRRPERDCSSLPWTSVEVEEVQEALAAVENNDMATKMAAKMADRMERVAARCAATGTTP